MLLLSEPNLLLLDEPTNDVDADMLAALEDLLDSWPGTLIVVSHDRYLLERVTDQQYAILDGGLRHVPGGVDEYLRLRAAQEQQAVTPSPMSAQSSEEKTASSSSSSELSGAERRAVQKEIGAIERRLEKLSGSIDRIHQRLADHDQSDYEGLQGHTDELREAEGEVAELEERWLELSESIS